MKRLSSILVVLAALALSGGAAHVLAQSADVEIINVVGFQNSCDAFRVYIEYDVVVNRDAYITVVFLFPGQGRFQDPNTTFVPANTPTRFANTFGSEPGPTYSSFYVLDVLSGASSEIVNINCVLGTDERIPGFDAPVAVYAREGAIQIYRLVDNGGKGSLAVNATAEQLAALPAAPASNTLIGSSGDVALYKLTSGEYQVNVGPDASGKVSVLTFRGIPAADIHTTSFSVSGAAPSGAAGAAAATPTRVTPLVTLPRVDSKQFTGRHTVQTGETLYRIARRYNLTWPVLAAANGITNPDLIFAGQVLAVPGGAAPAPVTTTAATPRAPTTGGSTYVVQAGDNLFRIALNHGVSLAALAAANGIANPALIYIGQVLVIPGG